MDLMANLCSQLTLNGSEKETGDDMVTQVFNTTMVEYRAHFDYADSFPLTCKVYAISGDACIVGRNAYMAKGTSRYAQLVGMILQIPCPTKSLL